MELGEAATGVTNWRRYSGGSAARRVMRATRRRELVLLLLLGMVCCLLLLAGSGWVDDGVEVCPGAMEATGEVGARAKELWLL